MSRILLRGGIVYSHTAPFATAALVVDGRFAWLGDDAAADAYADDATVVDLQGALVAPAFVDAHVHSTATGLALLGVDLSAARSASDVLDAVARYAIERPGHVILGHGWDDSAWEDGELPSPAHIDIAGRGADVYLTRVDVHSALASASLRARCAEIEGLPGYTPDGALSRAAHDRLRGVALGLVTAQQRRQAQEAALRAAAERGIASVHEMAGPVISGADDLRTVLELGRRADMPEVIGYWGEIHAHALARELGARGAAGDLSIDGAIGSRTACLRAPYADRPSTHGAQYIDSAAATEHLIEATARGVQGGFHVIGDGATDAAIDALLGAERALGADSVRQARHRLEHVEMIEDTQRAVLARLGVVASVQPAFDAAWGGEAGMYATRLGQERARTLNPLAAFAATGVVMGFGSDAPVTPLDPWSGVRAAVRHHNLDYRISARAAFAAHTRGGRRAAGDESVQPGLIAVDAPATYAVWAPGPLAVQAADSRVERWSTDPRAGTPPLPDLSAPNPACWRTVRDGETIFDSGALE